VAWGRIRHRLASLPGVARFELPDVLVLAAGGVLGEAWTTGVLAGLEDAAGLDLRDAEIFVGTSAGAIVAARLAAGRSPRRPSAPPAGRSEAGDDSTRSPRALLTAGVRGLAGAGWAATAPVASAAIALGAPGGALIRSALLARAPTPARRLDGLREEMRGLGSHFDGRLRVCCVERDRGRRVIFGAPGAPAASVADAVVASCSIPWSFAPVRIGEREYVDGGVWSATNLDAAPGGRGTQVLCLNPIAGLGGAPSRGTGALRGAFRVAAQLEVQQLRRRGMRVRHVRPEGDLAATMGADLMDPRPAVAVLEGGYRQGLALGGRG
jgi:NTE family protein